MAAADTAYKTISAVLKILFDIGFTEIDDYLNENSIPLQAGTFANSKPFAGDKIASGT